MQSFPGSTVHRPSRRTFGRGQSLQHVAAVAAPVASTVTVVITFDRPVIVSGRINLHVQGAVPLVLQVQDDATHVTQVYQSSVAGLDWSINPGEPVATFQGGGLSAAVGTF